jgi:hypothetical protein
MAKPITGRFTIVTDYPEGHLKHNAETNEVAVRTIFPEDQGPNLANMAWLVATSNSGARTVPSSAVADWPDLYSPLAEVSPFPIVEPVAPQVPPVVEEPTSGSGSSSQGSDGDDETEL